MQSSKTAQPNVFQILADENKHTALTSTLRKQAMDDANEAVLTCVRSIFKCDSAASYITATKRAEYFSQLRPVVEAAATVGECRLQLDVALRGVLLRASAVVSAVKVGQYLAVKPAVVEPVVNSAEDVIKMIEDQRILHTTHGFATGNLTAMDKKMIEHLIRASVSVQDDAFAMAERVAVLRKSVVDALVHIQDTNMRRLFMGKLCSLQADLVIHRDFEATPSELAASIEKFTAAIIDARDIKEALDAAYTDQLETLVDDLETRFEEFGCSFARMHGECLTNEQTPIVRQRIAAGDDNDALMLEFVPEKASAALKYFEARCMVPFRAEMRRYNIDVTEAEKDSLMMAFLSDPSGEHMERVIAHAARRLRLSQNSSRGVVEATLMFDRLVYMYDKSGGVVLTKHQEKFVKTALESAGDDRRAVAVFLAAEYHLAAADGCTFASERKVDAGADKGAERMDAEFFDITRDMCVFAFQIDNGDERINRAYHSAKKHITRKMNDLKIRRPRRDAKSLKTTKLQLAQAMLAAADEANAKLSSGELIVKMPRAPRKKGALVALVCSEDEYARGETEAESCASDEDEPAPSAKKARLSSELVHHCLP